MQLNNDDDYLAAECAGLTWLQSVTRIRRLALRVTNASVLLALVGGFVDPVAGSLGWSLASSALIHLAFDLTRHAHALHALKPLYINPYLIMFRLR